MAGTAALVIQAGVTDKNGNGKVNDEVRDTMNATALDLGSAGRDPQYGFGLVQADAAVAAVGPPPPAVNVALSTDKNSYDTAAGETTAVLTAVVTDENSGAISGLTDSAFSTTLDGLPVSVTFSETATPGTYTGSLDLTGVADGQHTVSVTATDTRGVSGSGSASFTTGSTPTTVHVDSVTYATEGGKGNNLHLLITVALVDNLGNAVSGASVSIDLYLDGVLYGSATGTTGTDGKVTFKANKAPSGCYTTTVTSVIASGLTWDGLTPANQFCK